ncbi:MAG: HAD family hydrolase [Sulfurospirillaceae bacterium]|nr:HAD family hydrolase [Sulfurospirillaceae bacterium]
MKESFSSPKCIIFDMDGTLIDSSQAMTNSVNFVRQRIGLLPIAKDDLEYYINIPDQNLSRIFYNTDTYSVEQRAMFTEHYLKSAPQSISLYAGVSEMLQKLQESFILAIATNAYDCFAKNMTESLKIDSYFSHIVGANNVSEPKPSAQMLEFILKEANCSHQKAIVVGDSIKDELSAQNAKIPFIFAEWGYGKSDSATCRAKSVKSLIDLLENF